MTIQTFLLPGEATRTSAGRSAKTGRALRRFMSMVMATLSEQVRFSMALRGAGACGARSWLQIAEHAGMTLFARRAEDVTVGSVQQRVIGSREEESIGGVDSRSRRRAARRQPPRMESAQPESGSRVAVRIP